MAMEFNLLVLQDSLNLLHASIIMESIYCSINSTSISKTTLIEHYALFRFFVWLLLDTGFAFLSLFLLSL